MLVLLVARFVGIVKVKAVNMQGTKTLNRISEIDVLRGIDSLDQRNCFLGSIV